MLKTKRELTGVTKVCTKCKNPRDTSMFNFNPAGSETLDSWCRPCKAVLAKEYYWRNVEDRRSKAKLKSRERLPITLQQKRDDPGSYLCKLARARAKRDGIAFSLVPEDIKVPIHCPALGTVLEFSYGKHATDASPTIDKLIPDLGYTPGNITVISKRANRIKADSSLQELESIVEWMKNRHQGLVV